jgi:hypothetical protein
MKNSQFLTSKELEERWQIKEIDLFAMVKEKIITCLTISNGYIDWQPIGLKINDMDRLFFCKPEIESFEQGHPLFRPQDAPYVLPNGEVPPFLDKKNLYFSKELSIAIETWLAIYGPAGTLDPKQKHKKQIIAYLNKRYPDLSDSAVDRISTLVNTDVAGAPKTLY